MTDELEESSVTVAEPHNDTHALLTVDDHSLVVMQNIKNGQLEIWGTDGRHPEIEKSFQDRKGIPVECRKCEYEWEYNGSGHNATCPNCQKNNNLHNHPLWNK